MHRISTPVERPHSWLAKAIHWSFVVLFAYAIAKGLDNVDQLADPAFWRFEMIFATVFLVILGARYVFMRTARPTALPDDTLKMMKTMARLGHLAIYVSIALIAVTGLAIGMLYHHVASDSAVMDAAIGLHEFFITASYIAIGVHVAAAVLHRFVGDGVWSSMVPVWKEK